MLGNGVGSVAVPLDVLMLEPAPHQILEVDKCKFRWARNQDEHLEHGEQ